MIARTPTEKRYRVAVEQAPYENEPGPLWTILFTDAGGQELAVGWTWRAQALAEGMCMLLNLAYSAGWDAAAPAKKVRRSPSGGKGEP